METNLMLNLIPHKYPFVFVDKILKTNEKGGQTVKLITANEKYSKGVCHSPVYYIEIFAQAVALIQAYKANKLGKKIKAGYIMSVKKLNADSLPQAGDALKINVEEIAKMDNTSMIKCEASVNENKYASARMSFYVEYE